MTEWTDEAERRLEDYLERVARLCRQQGLDAEDVVDDLRSHIANEVERADAGLVTEEHLQPVLARVGSPEQVVQADMPEISGGLLTTVDLVLIGPDTPEPAAVPAGARMVRAPGGRGLLLMRVLVGDYAAEHEAVEAARRTLRCTPLG